MTLGDQFTYVTRDARRVPTVVRPTAFAIPSSGAADDVRHRHWRADGCERPGYGQSCTLSILSLALPPSAEVSWDRSLR
jgi:hypothetical protein